ncbi:MAG: peptidylprolyl isomerase [Arenimonas sp.]|nr:peptidylprolyl isomerase [Arenimonas sp.]
MSVLFKSLALSSLLVSVAATNSVLAQTTPDLAPASTAVNSIVAVVDEDVVLRTELETAVNNIKVQYAKQAGQLPPEAILERQVLDRLILQKLQVNRANAIGIRITDAELNQSIQGIASNNKLTLEQFQDRLVKEGLSYDDYRNKLRDELVVQRLRQSYVQSRVQVSENEVEQMMASQKNAGPEVSLGNLLVSLPESPSATQVETAKKKIDGIRDLIVTGKMTFKAAAIRYSDAQNALDGGDIGWRSYESIPSQFASMINAMKPGDVSEPVRGPSGYQLITVAEIRDQKATLVDEYQAQAILIDPNLVGGNEVARQRAEDIHGQLLKGGDMAKLAKQYSSPDLNADKGGILDWFSQNQWGAQVGNQIVLLKDGELSPVMKLEAGYAIIKRLGKRSQDANADSKRRQARENIGQRKADEEYERFLRQLRSEAFVESRLAQA